MQPTKIDEGLADQDDDQHAIGRRDELSPQFHNLPIYEHLWLLHQHFESPRLIDVSDSFGIDLAAVFSGLIGAHAGVLEEGGLVGFLCLGFLGSWCEFGEGFGKAISLISFG